MFSDGGLAQPHTVLGGHAEQIVAPFVQPSDTERLRADVHVAGADERSGAAGHTLLDLVAEEFLVAVRQRRVPRYDDVVAADLRHPQVPRSRRGRCMHTDYTEDTACLEYIQGVPKKRILNFIFGITSVI